MNRDCGDSASNTTRIWRRIMKTKRTIHRLKRTAALAFFLGMLVCVGLFATGCKRKKCGEVCLLPYITQEWSVRVRGNQPTPCSAMELEPGDLYVMNVSSAYGISSKNIRACSDAPWNLTVTPSAGITARVEVSKRPRCGGNGGLLGSSSAPGEPVTISGPAGCITTGTDALYVVGSGEAGGTVTIEFN